MKKYLSLLILPLLLFTACDELNKTNVKVVSPQKNTNSIETSSERFEVCRHGSFNDGHGNLVELITITDTKTSNEYVYVTHGMVVESTKKPLIKY